MCAGGEGVLSIQHHLVLIHRKNTVLTILQSLQALARVGRLVGLNPEPNVARRAAVESPSR